MAGAKGGIDWQTRLHTSNPRRWALGAILLVWCAIGVTVAKVGLEVLVAVLQVLADPVPMDVREPMRNVPAVGLVLGGLLLVALLTGWTWVGIRFARFLLRMLTGEDQLALDSKGVTWRRWWWGPGSEVRYLPYSDVAAFPAHASLEVTALLNTGRTVTLATLGSAEEREALWQRLCKLSKRGGMPAVLEACAPEDHEAVPLPGGGVVLRRLRDGGRKHVWFLGGVALLSVASAAVVMWRQGIDGTSVEGPLLAVVLVGLAGLAGLGTRPFVVPQVEWEIRPGVLDVVWYHVGGPERTSHRAESLEARRDEFEEVGERPAGVSFSLWLHTPTGAVALKRDKVYAESIDHLGHWLAHRLKVPLNRSALQNDLPKAEPSRRHRVG